MSYTPLTAADLQPNKPARASQILLVHTNAENHEARLLGLAALSVIPLGGDPGAAYEQVAYASISFPVYATVDGTALGDLTFRLRFMGRVTAGDTCYVRLYNRTAALEVAASEITFDNTDLALVESGAFSLVESEAEYEIQVKATTGGAASPFNAYGFVLALA